MCRACTRWLISQLTYLGSAELGSAMRQFFLLSYGLNCPKKEK